MALQSADVQLLRCLNISSKKKGRKQPIKLQTEKRVNKSSSLQQHIWAVLLVTAAASLVIRKQMYKNPPANPFHSQGVCAGEDIHMSSHPCAGGSFMFPRSKGPAAYGCPAPRAPQPGPLQRASFGRGERPEFPFHSSCFALFFGLVFGFCWVFLLGRRDNVCRLLSLETPSDKWKPVKAARRGSAGGA